MLNKETNVVRAVVVVVYGWSIGVPCGKATSASVPTVRDCIQQFTARYDQLTGGFVCLQRTGDDPARYNLGCGTLKPHLVDNGRGGFVVRVFVVGSLVDAHSHTRSLFYTTHIMTVWSYSTRYTIEVRRA